MLKRQFDRTLDWVNSKGSIFDPERGIVYQDCYAPMGDGHVFARGGHSHER